MPNPREELNSVREETKPMTGIVSDGYAKISNQVSENHNLSKEQQADIDRRVFAGSPNKNVPEVAPINLVQPPRKDTFKIENYGQKKTSEKPRYVERIQKNASKQGTIINFCNKVTEFFGNNYKKIIIAGTLAGLVGYGAAVTASQQQGFEEFKENNPDTSTYIVDGMEMTATEKEQYLHDKKIATAAINGEEIDAKEISHGPSK